MRANPLVVTALLIASLAAPASAAATPKCFGRKANIVGTPRDDVLRGGRHDVIVGLGGDDVIVGSGRRFFACGNGGNDVIRGGAQREHLAGGAGRDRLYGSLLTDWLAGGPGDDVLNGDSSKDRHRGGPDELKGGPGHDALHGYVGHDVLDGGDGDDLLRGGDDNDDLVPGPGDDRVQGGDDHGADELMFPDAPGPVHVDLTEGVATGEGNDSLLDIEMVVGTNYDDELIGDERANIFSGLAGNDFFDGADGNDHFSMDSPRRTAVYEPGDDTVVGGPGRDSISFSELVDEPLTVDLTAGTATGEGADTISEVENVFAVIFESVTALGDEAANAIYTGTGDDEIRGGGGDDFLHASLGEDTIDGEDGVDECVHAEQAVNCES